MKKYVVGVIFISLVSSIFEILAPEGKGGDMKKYVKLIASLCVVCFTVVPIYDLLCELDDGSSELSWSFFDGEGEREKYEEIYNLNFSEMTTELLEKECCALIMSEFGVNDGDIDVKITVGEDMKLETVVLVIYPSAVSKDPVPMAKVLSEKLKSECRIIYEEKTFNITNN